MTRLDYHVADVRTKLAFRRFVQTLSWVACAAAGALVRAILVWKWFAWGRPPHAKWIALGVVGGIAFVVALIEFIRRPSAQHAALEIDRKLGLQEKFSTALTMRN